MTGARIQSAPQGETRVFFRVFAAIIVGSFVCRDFPPVVYSARVEKSDFSYSSR